MKSISALLLWLLLVDVGPAAGKWYGGAAEGDIMQELGGRLSADASTTLEENRGFREAAKRWQWWSKPGVRAVVEVAGEEDVGETIRYANSYSIPFIAQAGGHGSSGATSKVQDGILISLKKLNSIQISEDGTYATIGGGSKGGHIIIDKLWDAGK